MKGNLAKAMETTNTVYSQLVDIANKIIGIYKQDVDAIINDATNNIEKLSNDDIRNLILKLSMKSYSFSETKEKSALKADCSIALRKEAYALKFNETEGSVALRENTAIIETSDEIMTEAVYTLVSSLFKTTLDEIHRLIDSLKSVLMTRLQEAKLQSLGTSSTID